MKLPVSPIDPAQPIVAAQIAVLHEAIKLLWGPANATQPPLISIPTLADQATFDAEADMGPQTTALVRQFQGNTSPLPVTGIVDDRTAAAMNAALVKAGALGMVSGDVLDKDGNKLLVTTILVADLPLTITVSSVESGGREVRGQGVVDTAGEFATYTVIFGQPANIEFSMTKVVPGVGGAPAGTAAVPVRTNPPVYWGAKGQVTIPLQVPSLQNPFESEFQRLVRVLPADFQTPASIAAVDVATIQVTANNTHEAVDKVTHWVIAKRLEVRSQAKAQVIAEFFYALLREDTLIGIALDRETPPFIWTEITLATELDPLLDQIAILSDQVTVQNFDVITDGVIRAGQEKFVDWHNLLQTDAGPLLAVIADAIEIWKTDPFEGGVFVLNDAERAFVAGPLAPQQAALNAVLPKVNGGGIEAINRVAQAVATPAQPFQANEFAILEVLLPLCGGEDRRALAMRMAYAAEIQAPADVVPNLVGKRPAEIDAKLAALPWLSTANEAAERSTISHVVAWNLEEMYFEEAYVAQRARKLGAAANNDKILTFLAQHPNVYFRELSSGARPNTPWDVGGTAWKDVPDEVKALHRLAKLTHRFAYLEGLMTSGIGSAQQIRAMGEGNFVTQAQAYIPPDDARLLFGKAAALADNAQRLYTKIAALHQATQVAALSTPRQILPNGTKVPKAWEINMQTVPNWEALFGSLDACACNWCESIFGPGAYFADVMRFLANRTLSAPPAAVAPAAPAPAAAVPAAAVAVGAAAAGGAAALCQCDTTNALNVLLTRRPDLEFIDLNCPNAETRMPYIDLVCELLEDAVCLESYGTYAGNLVCGAAPDQTLIKWLNDRHIYPTRRAIFSDKLIQGRGLILRDTGFCLLFESHRALALSPPTQWVVRELRQTFVSSEELLAAPQYVNAEAYKRLRDAKCQLCLPFDLDFDEASSYLAVLGIRRSDLMKWMQKTPDTMTDALAVEILGLSEAEATRIVSEDLHQGKFWGYAVDQDAVDAMAVVKDLLVHATVSKREALTFEDVRSLVRGDYFIRATAGPVRIDPPTPCEGGVPMLVPFDAQALDRVNRILRLHRRLPWPLHTLSRVLSCTTLAPHNLDLECLRNLATLWRTAEELEMDAIDLVPLWIDLEYDDAHPEESDYAALFLNKTKTGGTETEFLVDEIRKNANPPPGHVISLLKDHLSYVGNCLGARSDDLTALLGYLQRFEVLGTEIPLTMARLSRVNAWWQLSKLVELDMGACLLLAELMSAPRAVFDPFAGTAEFLRYVRAALRLADWSLGTQEINYWLRHDIQPPTRLQTVAEKTAYRDEELKRRALAGETIETIAQNLAAAYRAARDKEVEIPAAPNRDPWLEALGKALTQVWILPDPQRPATETGKTMAVQDQIDALRYLNDPPTVPLKRSLVEILSDAMAGYDDLALILADPLVTTPTSWQADPPDPQVPTDAHPALAERIIRSINSTLTTLARKQAIDAALAEALATSQEIIQVVVTHAQLTLPPDPAATLQGILLKADLINDNPVLVQQAAAKVSKVAQYAFKLVTVIGALNMDAADTAWSFAALPNTWLSLAAIPPERIPNANYSAWENLLDGLKLIRSIPPVAKPGPPATKGTRARIKMTDLLTPTNPATPQSTQEKRKQWLLLSKMSDEIFDALVANLALTDEAYSLPQTYLQIRKAATLLQIAGLSVARAVELIKNPIKRPAVNQLRQTLKERSTAKAWLSLLRRVQDPLRQKKRDALKNYLLYRPTNAGCQCQVCGGQKPELRFANEASINSYFLVDILSEPINQTSRLVLGYTTLQQFLNRCQGGLEEKVTVDPSRDPDWLQTEWIKRQRLWEANRRIFAYPENWLEPDVRDDKSQFFKELEKTLQQNDVNDDSAGSPVEEASLAYLDKLDNVAMLEVMATYYEEPDATVLATVKQAPVPAVLHVFARTKTGDPATYFYRRQVIDAEPKWTPWEKIDLEIATDHLLAFVRDRRLCLAWPVFQESIEEDRNTPKMGDPRNEDVPIPKPKRRWSIRLAVSEYTHGRWQPKRVSKSGLVTQYQEITSIRADEIRLASRFYICDDENAASDDGFYVVCYYVPSPSPDPEVEQAGLVLQGAFNLTGCKGFPEIVADDKLPRISLVKALSASSGDAKGVQRVMAPVVVGAEFHAQRWQGTPAAGNELAFKGASGIRSKPVHLFGTPSGLRVTYPYQVSVLDRFIVDLLSFLDGGQPAPENTIWRPSGVLMPFFFDDGRRSYAVVPALKPSVPQANQPAELFIGQLVSIIKGTPGNSFTDELAAAIHGMPSQNPAAATYISQKLKDWRNIPEFNNILSLVQDLLRLHLNFKPLSFYHPYVCRMRKALLRGGFPELMVQPILQQTPAPSTFNAIYAPTASVPDTSLANDCYDFSPEGAYSGYNWEVFFHFPYLIGSSLNANLKFDKAQTWYNYIFDPRGVPPLGLDPALASGPRGRYWITRPFRERQAAGTQGDSYAEQELDALFRAIAGGITPHLHDQIDEWRKDPFKPYLVARGRTVAFQKATVMRYLKNLMDWGDSLFRQDTTESVNEARQLYELAAELLGPRPLIVSKEKAPDARCYAEIACQLDEFGNILVQMEHHIAEPGEHEAQCPCHSQTPLPAGAGLYFCIPPNDKLLGYWDTLDDRLFKIRNSMNIEGLERQLALFAPPIDPGLLARAVAAGISIGDILANTGGPLPNYRFQILAQKATEIVQMVNSFGAALREALEKRDAEALGIMRERHQKELLEAVLQQKEQQVKEAQDNLEALENGRTVVTERLNFYKAIARISGTEETSMTLHGAGILSEIASTILQTLAGGVSLVPTFNVGASGFGGSPVVTVSFGGGNLSDSARSWGTFFGSLGGILHSGANLTGTIAGYERRWDDWKLQERLATREITQVDKQIAAAAVRVEIAKIELQNHQLQMDQSEQVLEFVQNRKFTNQDLYEWLISELSALYHQAYQLALKAALVSERAFHFELGEVAQIPRVMPTWDATHKGLLAGEKLLFGLKAMESEYLERNRREYEITKHISLVRLDPALLLQLKYTGQCEVTLPEWLFDMDYPGQYFRRIKSLSISLPCVAGPYTSLNCTLTLKSSRIRNNPADKANGAADEKNFLFDFSRVEAIATSSCQNDSGLFEMNFKDERYLPFEGAGVLCTLGIDLPKESNRQLDFGSLADLILHVKYTARQSGPKLRDTTSKELKKMWKSGDPRDAMRPLVRRLFVIADEFPSEWIRFANSDVNSATRTLALSNLTERLPYYWPGAGKTLTKVKLLAYVGKGAAPVSISLKAGAGAVIDGTWGPDITPEFQVAEWTNVTSNGEWVFTGDFAGQTPSLFLQVETNLSN